MTAESNYTGNIVEFLDSGEVKLALVTRHAKETLLVTDVNGRQRRVALKQLIVVHPDTVESSAFAARADQLKTEISKHTTSVDTELLWESVYEDGDAVDLKGLAEGYFGDARSVHRSAVFRAVMGDPARFKFKGRKITPRTPAQVEEQQIALARRRERQEQRVRTIQWMAATLARADDGNTNSPDEAAIQLPAEAELALPRLERLLTKGVNDGIEQWLDEVRGSHSRVTTALKLLIATSRLPPDADLRLVTAGVRIAFPDDALTAVGILNPFTPEESRRDFRALAAFSIDDEDTREIDDALTVEDLGDRIRVGIHIADVSHFVSPDDPLDREAFARGASVYLPYRTVPMFPERLSCDLASLVAGNDRPAMTALVDFRPDGELIESQLCRSQINVRHRLSYDEADALLKGEGDDEPTRALRRLQPIATSLQGEREANGALTIRRPELKLLVENGEVALKVLDGTSPSRQIVSELMILTNRLVAEYAASNGVAVIFRAQDPPREPINQPATYDPVALDQIFRLLTKSKLSLTPQPHSGLGLNAYTQLTSPLRRYPDLVIQRQLLGHLSGGPLPYEQQQLLEVLGSAHAVEAENRTLENSAAREFSLRYLEKRRANFDSEAIVVARLTGGYLIEPCGLPIRGKLLARWELELGDRVRVNIEDIDPEGGLVTFRTPSE